MTAIEVTHLRKVYRRYGRKKQFATLKSALLSGNLMAELRPEDSFIALDDVSFSVAKGKTFGIIGRNGSGKSTALKLVAGITKPTSGTVTVAGRVSALIELGAGFHPEISGRENVFINGMMLGLSKREIARRFDDIVAFAELEEFIDAPVKTYSSGMYMRLGFAVAINVDPDVLLVDEVLAVGDEAFTHKCLDKFAEFRRRGRTVLIVTHTLDLVTRFCDEAIWLDRGHVRAQGDPRRIVDAYITDVQRSEDAQLDRDDAERQARAAAVVPVHGPAEAGPDETGDHRPAVSEAPNDQRAQTTDAQRPTTHDLRPTTHDSNRRPPTADEPADMFKAGEGRWGTREAEITSVALVGPDEQAGHVFAAGAPLTIRIDLAAAQPLDDVVVGVAIHTVDGVTCYGTNTDIDDVAFARLEGTAQVAFRIDRLDLVEGTYMLDVAVHRHSGVPYDYHRKLHTFRVKSRTREVGIARLAHRWQTSGGLETRPSAAGPSTPSRSPRVGGLAPDDHDDIGGQDY